MQCTTISCNPSNLFSRSEILVLANNSDVLKIADVYSRIELLAFALKCLTVLYSAVLRPGGTYSRIEITILERNNI